MYSRLKVLKFSGFILGAAFIFAAVSDAGPREKSLTRSEDYILFLGDDVPSLIGAEVGDLHLYAYNRSGFRVLPFQIDKRDAEGRYVFPNETRYDPSRDGTRLDSNDELVFMARDAGNRRPDDAWLDSALKGVEIELVDPLDRGRAWVYLFECPGVEPPETQDYIRYQLEGDKELIESDNYQLGVWLTQAGMYLLRLRRPDGSWGRDVLESQKTGMIASLLRGAIPVYIPEQEIKKRITGVIDGPVRVIRDQLSFIKIKIIGLDLITETFYINYFNGHIAPLEFSVPVTISKLFLNVDMYWALTFNETIKGSVYKNQANPKGILLDGKPDPEINLTSDNRYISVSGPEGSIIEVIDLGDLKAHKVILTTLVREETTRKEPENQSGEITAGYWYRNTKRVPKGTYRYWLYHYYPYPFSERKVQEILNMVERPVEIKVNPVSPPPGYP